MVTSAPCIFMYTNFFIKISHPSPLFGGGGGLDFFMPKLRCSRRWQMVLAQGNFEFTVIQKMYNTRV